jgi:TetR/AcrR family transcriptional regulator, tetracycline repressor protein
MAKTSRSREPAARLNEETVVDAALALIAERSLDGLSMRALGEQLGVEAMSLYHWFASKDRLLDAVADRLLAKVVMPPTPTAETWRDWQAEVARSYRRVGLAHRRAFPLLATRRFLSPGAAAFLQANIAAHLAAGFTAREALRLTRSIGAYVNGIVLAEVASSPAPQSSLPEETAAALKLPALDGAFEYGLACILDGAHKRLPNKRRGRS